MNRLRYRVIFSQVRAAMMVVPDIARTGRAAVAGRAIKQFSPFSSTDSVPARLSVSALSFAVLLASGLVSVPVAARSVIHRDTSARVISNPIS
ncbi:hypothetical protein DPU24_16575 [Salmonella enterica subsp. enterica serovar Oranienburg]|nr:hypothetical protein [Salmonella enterica subsp. enterica serovar Oranienburg]